MAFFVFLGHDRLGKMVGAKVVMEVVVQVVVLVWWRWSVHGVGMSVRWWCR